MQASNRLIIDGELVFRAAGEDAATGSVSTDSLAADKLQAYWNNGHAESHQFGVVVDIESIEADNGQTYEFSLQTDDSEGFSSPRVIATQSAGADTSKLVFGVARETLEGDDTRLRVALATTLADIEPATVTFTAAAFVGLEITVDDGDANEVFTFDDGLGGTLDPGADEEASATALADAINNSSTIDCTATVDGAEVTITSNFLQAGDPLGTASVTSANDDDPPTATIVDFAQADVSVAFNAYATPFLG